MKKYIKPETRVENVVLTSMIAMSAVDVQAEDDLDVLTKDRDVWKDGFWD